MKKTIFLILLFCFPSVCFSAWKYNIYTGKMDYYLGGGAGDNATFEDLTVNGWSHLAGNVGIGTTSPAYLLDIVGGYLNINAGVLACNNCVQPSGIRLGSDPASNDRSPIISNFRGSNSEAQGIDFQTRNGGYVNAMRILGNGNVGIGTTKPLAQLVVLGVGNERTGMFYDYTQRAGVSFGNLIADPNYGGAMYFVNDLGSTQGATRMRASYSGVGTAGNPNFAIDRSTTSNAYGADPTGLTYVNSLTIDGGSGDVGIGVASPIATLSVRGSSVADTGKILMLSDSTPTYRLTVQANGNVGIGTTNPLASLDTTGAIRSTQNSGVSWFNGNLGIGTSAPAMTLSLKTTGTAAGQGLYINATTTNDAGRIILKAAGTATCYQLFIGSTGTVTTAAVTCP